MRLYFGHPINAYNIPLEVSLLKRIEKAFPDWEIENPNQERYTQQYLLWKKTRGDGMAFFYKEVLPTCQGGVFLAFPEGTWGAGVFGEAECLAMRACPIWEITHQGIITKIRTLSRVRALTIAETKLRVKKPFFVK